MNATPASCGAHPLKWLRRAGAVAWLACLATYALVAYQLFARVIHPHFLPLVSLMLAGSAAAIAAVALGVWRIVRGPNRIGAIGWSLFAVIPVLLWAAHGTYAVSTIRTPGNRPMDYRLKLASVGAAAVADGLSRLVYPNRLEGEHTVMIYDDCADPEADLAAMDRHVEHVGQVLGRPLPTKVHWVRGPVAGFRGVSLVGTALCDAPRGGPGAISHIDRHEAAHNVFGDQMPATACPPALLVEGWAESQSGVPLQQRARELLERRGGGRVAWSLPQLLSPERYGSGGWEVYFQGGLVVDFLLRRYGGEKLFDLCATCRPGTIADDFQRVYGAGLDELDGLFWADLRQQAYGRRQERQKSISAELGLPEDGPNDESARQEFLKRYPKEVEKLKEAYRHVRMAATATWEPPKGQAKGTFRERRFEIVHDGDRGRLTGRDDEWTMVTVATPQRSFLLVKKASDPRFETRWALAGPAAGTTTMQEIRAVTPESDAAYQAAYVNLPELVGLPCFTATRAVRSQDGPRRLVRVYFESEQPDDPAPTLQAGWLSFRPDECWALEAYQLRVKGFEPHEVRAKGKPPQPFSVIHEGVVRYQGRHKGVPVLDSVEQKVTRDGKPAFTKTFRITGIDFGQASDAIFDLSSFDADPPAKGGGTAWTPEEDIFVRLTRWLVWALWSCSAGAMISLVASRFTHHKGTKDTKGR